MLFNFIIVKSFIEIYSDLFTIELKKTKYKPNEQ